MLTITPVIEVVNAPTRSYEFVVAALAVEDLTPYMFGALDAEKGEPCFPERYYIFDGAIAEYREGYTAVAAEMIDTATFFGFDDDAPLGLTFTPSDGDDCIEDDHDLIRYGG